MHAEGGGWCVGEEDCGARSFTGIGSTEGLVDSGTLSGDGYDQVRQTLSWPRSWANFSL